MSLVETMVATAVLGFGVVALGDLFTQSERVESRTQERVLATEIAILQAERVATMPLDALPACPGVGGCRLDRTSFAVPLPPAAGGAFPCTQIVDDVAVDLGAIADPLGKYRVDTALNPHPSASQQPEARVLEVTVCWMDGNQTVQEVRVERLLVPTS